MNAEPARDQKRQIAEAVLYTVEHSNRGMDEFLALLRQQRIVQLVDIRTLPGSRSYPHFDQERLSLALTDACIAYLHMPELGGRRCSRPNSINTGWRHPAFRGYSDYMQTDAFRCAVERLAELAQARPTVIICSEAVPWRCHRSLVGRDAGSRHRRHQPHEHATARTDRLGAGQRTWPARGRFSGAGERTPAAAALWRSVSVNSESSLAGSGASPKSSMYSQLRVMDIAPGGTSTMLWATVYAHERMISRKYGASSDAANCSKSTNRERDAASSTCRERYVCSLWGAPRCPSQQLTVISPGIRWTSSTSFFIPRSILGPVPNASFSAVIQFADSNSRTTVQGSSSLGGRTRAHWST